MPYLIALIYQNEEQVKSGHDGVRHVDIVFQRLGAIVTAINGVGCSQDGCTGIQCGLGIGTVG